MSTFTIEGNPSGGGNVTLMSPASASDRTLVLPDADGTLVPSSDWIAKGNLSSAAEHLGIPAWAKRILVRFKSMSTNGASSIPRLRLGTSSGYVLTGSRGTVSFIGTPGGNAQAASWSDLHVVFNTTWAATSTHTGMVELSQVEDSGGVQLWHASFLSHDEAGAVTYHGVYSIPITGDVDRLSFITGSADVFDNGQWWVRFEG